MKKILIADDEKNMRWILSKNLIDQGYLTIEAKDGAEAFKLIMEQEPDLIILDYKMPEINGLELLKKIKKIYDKMPVIMITAHGSTEDAVEAIKAGAMDYLSKPFDIEELKLCINKVFNIDHLQKEVEYLRSEVSNRFNKSIVGNSKRMHEIFLTIEKIADTNSTVLITGESGTGKELIANAIHNLSLRKELPYIRVNCGAIPENLLESELFGYEKGAFTGAQSRKPGRFDRAQGGTIFLDEIGELSLPLQVKLLRVLQEKEYERVGGTEVIKANVRVIAATNRDLDKLVADGKFREDLLYRLKVIPIELPSLRERREDILPLIQHFISKHATDMNKGHIEIEKEAIEILLDYDFPGNIRELENIIERMVILSTDGVIKASMIPKEVVISSYLDKDDTFILPDNGISLENVEKSLLRQALARSNGNQTHAARLLGISRSALIYRMEKFDLK